MLIVNYCSCGRYHNCNSGVPDIYVIPLPQWCAIQRRINNDDDDDDDAVVVDFKGLHEMHETTSRCATNFGQEWALRGQSSPKWP